MSDTPLTLRLVREAIFNELDRREWDFTNDEQRVDFADAVIAWIPVAYKLQASKPDSADGQSG